MARLALGNDLCTIAGEATDSSFDRPKASRVSVFTGHVIPSTTTYDELAPDESYLARQVELRVERRRLTSGVAPDGAHQRAHERSITPAFDAEGRGHAVGARRRLEPRGCDRMTENPSDEERSSQAVWGDPVRHPNLRVERNNPPRSEKRVDERGFLQAVRHASAMTKGRIEATEFLEDGSLERHVGPDDS